MGEASVMKRIAFNMFAVFSIFLALSVVEGQKVRTVDGVTIVSNGKKPVKVKGQPSSFSLGEELAIGGGEDPEKSFSQVTALAVDAQGTIFALDFREKKIKVFDRSGKYVRSIGQSGQGPGELGTPIGIQLGSDGSLLVEDITARKLVVFRPTGEFLDSISLSDKLGLMNIKLDGRGNFLGTEMGFEQDAARMFYEVKKYDRALKPLFSIDRIEFPIPLPGGGTKLNPFELVSIYQFGPGGVIYYARGMNYEIRVYSPEGKHIRTITRDYDRQKVTPQDIEEMLEKIPSAGQGINARDMYSWPEFFPPFQNFILDDQGRLYVRTYQKGRNKEEYWIDVFDPEGRFIAQFVSWADLRLIKNGKAYAIENSADGFPVIKRYNLAMQ